MKAHATLTVARRGSRSVISELRSDPPLTLRRTGSPGATAQVHVVGTAAGPLGGDSLRLDVSVLSGASLELRSTGAQIALRGTSSVHFGLRVDGEAVIRQEPTVLARGCLVHNHSVAELGSDARLLWQDLVVLGRHGEEPGKLVQRWDVTRGGRPVLRTTTTLVDPAMYRSPAVIGSASVLGTALVSAPGLAVRPSARPGAAVHALREAALVTVLGVDAVEVSTVLDELTGSCVGSA
ncbi:urease accessory protein UreD [Allokutzneria albata]|uniref:Urease accessory protein UreD n=1 Tax=Allokutzneria albata TaxID=211114 RepID=A0A1H0D6M7_ALLAB|nr:urease accessory protein UreD [Allokutzneria albata]SDN65847.1 urease accessory protein [Allokutzneria albata]